MELFNIYGTSFKKKYYKYYRTYFLPFFLFSPQYFPLWIQIRIRILKTDPGTGGKITAEPNPQSCRPAAGNMLHNHNFLGRNNFPVYSIVLSFFMILLRLG